MEKNRITISGNAARASGPGSSKSLFIYGLLVCITLCAYWGVWNHHFINYDDYEYVVENISVREGLSTDSVLWAFTSTSRSNWHPLTWLSHMVDVEFFGLDPGMHHLTNLLFHIINTLLLFTVLKRMSGAVWQSGFVAALFAVHPLHVESVAWVAERKDILSTFFWILTLYGYAVYAEKESLLRYLGTLLLFFLGLMAKPMVVTLPFVLMLLDYWPLRRYRFVTENTRKGEREKSAGINLLLEKVPFLLLSAGSCLMTIYAQQTGGALANIQTYPFVGRLANALVSYILYLYKTLLPINLAIAYPYPETISLTNATICSIILALISTIAVKTYKTHPYFIVGWLWFAGTLVPVIGIVQVGTQGLADRYTYIPLIGIFIIFAWGGTALATKWRLKNVYIGTIVVSLIGILLLASRIQVNYWKDSITLFKHSLDVTAENFVAQNNLGLAYKEKGMPDKAIVHYRKAIQINPDFETAYLNLGVLFSEQGDIKKAAENYARSLEIKPGNITALTNVGNLFLRQRKLQEAAHYYTEALRINSDYAPAYNGLGAVMASSGNYEKAIPFFQKALQADPKDKAAKTNLEKTLTALDQTG